MMYISIDNEYQLQAEFVKFGRDYFTLDGYRAMFEMCEECGDTELDVIGFCCEFCEDAPETIADDYRVDCRDEDGDIDIDKLMDYLNYRTYAVELPNGNIFYQNF